MPDKRAQTSPQNGKLGGGPKGARGPQLATRERAHAAQRHAELTADAVVEQIARGALFDPGDLLDDKGNFKPFRKLTEAQRQSIAGIEFVMKNAEAGDGEIDRILKIKFEPRAKYVEMAARYHSLLRDQLDVNVTDVGSRLDRAREAARLRNARELPDIETQPLLPAAREKETAK